MITTAVTKNPKSALHWVSQIRLVVRFRVIAVTPDLMPVTNGALTVHVIVSILSVTVNT